MKMMIRRYAMRVGAVALCSAALCATPMMAQGGAPGGGAPGGGGGGRGMMTPDAQLAQLTTTLTLSADQQAKIKPILDADAKKIADIRSSGEDMLTARPKMMAIRTDQHAAIKALLTADQAAKYDAMPQGRGTRRRRRRHHLHLLHRHLHSNCGQDSTDGPESRTTLRPFCVAGRCTGRASTGTMFGVTEPVFVAMRFALPSSCGAGLRRNKKGQNEE